VVSVIEGFGKGGGDRVDGVADDACIALKRITEPIIAIGQEPSRLVQSGEAWRRASLPEPRFCFCEGGSLWPTGNEEA
jgi:hypothetical protein